MPRYSLAVLIAIVVLIAPAQDAYAIPLDAIRAQAQQVSVTIQSEHPGSGVIVARRGDRYTVLTTKHSVQVEDQYSIVTPDGESYAVEWRSIQPLPDLDLALVEFKSDQAYAVATLSSAAPQPGQPLFVTEKSRSSLDLIPGSVIPRLEAIPFTSSPLSQGYSVFYSNIAKAGMSGGAVFNSRGQVVAIHGRSEGENITHSSRALTSSRALNPNALNPEEEGEESDRLYLGYGSGITIRTLLNYQPKLRFTVSTASPELANISLDDRRSLTQTIAQLTAPPLRQDSALAWGNHANALYRMGRLPEGIRALQRAIALAPDVVPFRYAEGLMFYTLGRSPDAVKAFDQALEINPKFERALQGKAIALASLGQVRPAIELLDQTLKLNPRNGIAWFWRGKLFNQLQQSEWAIESLNYATSLQPDLAEAWIEKSKAWAAIGQPKAAQDALNEAQKLGSET